LIAQFCRNVCRSFPIGLNFGNKTDSPWDGKSAFALYKKEKEKGTSAGDFKIEAGLYCVESVSRQDEELVARVC
jgi:hypothetical protein